MSNEVFRDRVLVVEDEPYLMEEIVISLRECQIEPLTATNGTIALDLLKEHADISVVLTDIRMPYMNGTELLKRAKEELDPKRRLHWFALTGFVGSDLSDFPGFEEVLYKPIQLAMLAKLLRRKLDLSPPSASSRRE